MIHPIFKSVDDMWAMARNTYTDIYASEYFGNVFRALEIYPGKIQTEADSTPYGIYEGKLYCRYFPGYLNDPLVYDHYEAPTEKAVITVASDNAFQAAIPVHAIRKNGEEVVFMEEMIVVRENGKWLIDGFPGIAVYWPKKGGVAVKSVFKGRDGWMPAKAGSLVEQLIDSVEQTIGDWKVYAGGKFTASRFREVAPQCEPYAFPDDRTGFSYQPSGLALGKLQITVSVSPGLYRSYLCLHPKFIRGCAFHAVPDYFLKFKERYSALRRHDYFCLQ